MTSRDSHHGPKKPLPVRGWRRYAVAALLASLALALKLLLRQWFGPQPVFPLFYAAVLISAWYGGFRGGMLTALLGTLAGRYIFHLQVESSIFNWDAATLGDAIFLAETSVISWGVEQLHISHRQTEQLASELLSERYRLLDTAHDGILTVDEKSTIEYVNKRMSQMLDLSPQQMLGHALFEFVDDADHDALRHALSGEPCGLSESWDLHLQSGSRSGLLARLSASPIFRERQLTGTLCMFIDISSQVQSERALLRSEEEMRTLTEALPQIVWTASAAGAVEYYNQRWFQLTGLDEHQSYSRDGWLRAAHPDDLERCRNLWTHCLAEATDFECELRLHMAVDDRWRWFLSRALPLRDAQGQVLKWVGTCTDIDAQKRAADSASESDFSLHG